MRKIALLVLYYTWTAADHLPYLAYSRDGGQSWSAPLGLKPPGLIEAAIPRVAAHTPGKVAVTTVRESRGGSVCPLFISRKRKR